MFLKILNSRNIDLELIFVKYFFEIMKHFLEIQA